MIKGHMGNTLAYIILFLFPIVSIRLYQKKTIQEATLWVVLGGFMLLAVKTEVDFPLIPPIGKHSMPVLSMIIGCWFIKGKSINYFKHKSMLSFLSIFILFLPFITTELNTDSFVIGGHWVPALTHHDALSAIINKFLFITPFFIGVQFFRHYKDQILMFKILMIAGLWYSIPIIYEVRMSPQLHSAFYGYFPHSFLQQRRMGGFRPVVFMGHGLWVAFFIACALTVAVTLQRIGEGVRRFPAVMVNYFLLTILLLCKSMASIMYGLFSFFMISKMSYQAQFRAAILLAILAIIYPTLSIIKVFPHQAISEIADTYMGPERAESLNFRFKNEDLLLEHGRERFFFGWGGWGRNRVYDEETGKDKTITDGRWIITFGTSGWIGFMVEFLMMALAIFRAKKAALLSKDNKQKRLLAAHALLVSIIMIDQLPNASLEPWLWLVVGVLLGCSEQVIADSKGQNTATILY